MSNGAISGAEFKKQLREGQPKMGLFVNSHSPTVAEQLAHSGYDWLLIDSQHGPMGYEKLSAMLAAISSGGAIGNLSGETPIISRPWILAQTAC